VARYGLWWKKRREWRKEVEFELDVERWRIPVQSSGTSNSRGALEEVGQDLAELVSEGKAVLVCLRKVGRLVDYTGFLARLAQAPRIRGALDIRWWRLGSSHPGTPVLVRWLQTRAGKARTKRVLRARTIVQPLFCKFLRWRT
jgi:hypothetical protein